MNKKTVLLNAAIAGIFAAGSVATILSTAHAAGDRCYGVNACKGKGECGGKGTSCAGSNECKGKGWVSKSEAECLKEGGRLTEEPAASDKSAKSEQPDETKTPSKKK